MDIHLGSSGQRGGFQHGLYQDWGVGLDVTDRLREDAGLDDERRWIKVVRPRAIDRVIAAMAATIGLMRRAVAA